jgi:hypothetical protein
MDALRSRRITVMVKFIVGVLIIQIFSINLFAAKKCKIHEYDATYAVYQSHGSPIGSVKNSSTIHSCKNNKGECYHLKSHLKAHEFIFTEEIKQESYGKIVNQVVVPEKYVHSSNGQSKTVDLMHGHYDQLSYLLSLQNDISSKDFRHNYVVNTINGVKFIIVHKNESDLVSNKSDHDNLTQINYHDTKGNFGSLFFKIISNNNVMTKAVFHKASGDIYIFKLQKYGPNLSKCLAN